MEKKTRRTVYVTKYWETRGIMEKTGDVDPETPSMIQVSQVWYVHKPHWHNTIEEARQQVAKDQKRRIKSVEAKLKRLRDIDPATMPPQ